MRRVSPGDWFDRQVGADAARFVVVCERIRLGDWRRMIKTPEGRYTVRRDDGTNPPFDFAPTNADVATAVRALNRRMSPLIVRRVQRERRFGQLLLLEAVRAWLDDDVNLAKGVMRRLVDASAGYEYLAVTTEGHPKSLIRMLSPQGNPSATHLTAILNRLARHHGASFNVELR